MKLLEGTEVWVPTEKSSAHHEKRGGSGKGLFEHGVVQADQKSKRVFVQLTASGKTVTVRMAYPVNPTVEPDMTGLWYIHEPGILHNLTSRSLNDDPYTFMGPVLVAINPLKTIKEPEGALGSSKALNSPHPFAVAEQAIQQLMHSKQSQSIVVSGESGAGKTESSKLVLRHLVARLNAKTTRSSLDLKLLASNPILEAFGNAATVRNHNSSRFGKFLKLKVNKKHELVGASVETYLLERSRVTSHQPGERAFHIYYFLLLGLSKDKRKKWGLEGGVKAFQYTQSEKERNTGEMKVDDLLDTSIARFAELRESLDRFGFHEKQQDELFRVVAAVLHLGNIQFVSGQNDSAVIKDKSKSSLKLAAKMLDVPVTLLSNTLCQRVISVPGSGETVAFRNTTTASFARDAIARALYSRAFDWLVDKVTEFLDNGSNKASSVKSGGLEIGVLDIFGFESFEHNSLEQLLINYTNEALQSTFETQVFKAERDLFKREGLITDETEKNQLVNPVKSNVPCMELLQGKQGTSPSTNSSKQSFGSSAKSTPGGLLGIVDEQSQVPQASDTKLVGKLHSEFANVACFGKVHPKDRSLAFVVEHFAGPVTYTIGSFILKNSDHLPPEADSCVLSSTSNTVTQVWRTGLKVTPPSSGTGSVPGRPPKINIHNMNKPGGGFKQSKAKKTIVSKFRIQIQTLLGTLDETRCWFIRCIKPNADMSRAGDWLNQQYICAQMRCLSVPQTAALLKQGFPTRIPFAQLTDLYAKLLPKKCIRTWKVLGKREPKSFVSGLFYAFQVSDQDFKLGQTRAFFRTGKLEQLNTILEQPREWKTSSASKKSAKGKKTGKKSKDKFDVQIISKRFRHYHVRRRWRICFAKMLVINKFLAILSKSANREQAAIRIQVNMRKCLVQWHIRRMHSAATVLQAKTRGVKVRMKLAAEAKARKRRAKERRAKAKAKAKEAARAFEKKTAAVREKQIAARKQRKKILHDAKQRLLDKKRRGSKHKEKGKASDKEEATKSPRVESNSNESMDDVKEIDEAQEGRERADGVFDVVWCLHPSCFESPCFFRTDDELEAHTAERHANGPNAEDDNFLTEEEQALMSEPEVKQRKEKLRRSIRRKSFSLSAFGIDDKPELPMELKELIEASVERDAAQLDQIEAQEEFQDAERKELLVVERTNRVGKMSRKSLKRATAEIKAKQQRSMGSGRRMNRTEQETLVEFKQNLFREITQLSQPVQRGSAGSLGKRSSGQQQRFLDDSVLTRRGSAGSLGLDDNLRTSRGRRLSASSLMDFTDNESNEPEIVHGWVCKLAINSQRSWKQRYAVFDPQHLSITYYKDCPSHLKDVSTSTSRGNDKDRVSWLRGGVSSSDSSSRTSTRSNNSLNVTLEQKQGTELKPQGSYFLEPLLRPLVSEHDRLPKGLPELPESLRRRSWSRQTSTWRKSKATAEDKESYEHPVITYLKITGGTKDRGGDGVATIRETMGSRGRTFQRSSAKSNAKPTLRRGLSRGKSLSRASSWFAKQSAGKRQSTKWTRGVEGIRNPLVLAFSDASVRSRWAQALRRSLLIDVHSPNFKDSKVGRSKRSQVRRGGDVTTIVKDAFDDFNELCSLHQKGKLNDENFKALAVGVADIRDSESEVSSDEEVLADKDDVQKEVTMLKNVLEELNKTTLPGAKARSKVSSFYPSPKNMVRKFLNWPSPKRRGPHKGASAMEEVTAAF